MLKKRLSGIVALLGVPTLFAGTAYAKTTSPSSTWKQVTLNTDSAPNMQMDMKETVTVSGGVGQNIVDIDISDNQQQKGSKVTALLKVTEVDHGSNQKQTVQLFQSGDNLYQYTSNNKWQLVEHIKSALIGQYVSQLYTNIKMRNISGGHRFTMGMDPKEMASLLQGVFGQTAGPINTADLFKNTKSSMTVNTAKIAGSEKISKLTANINILTTAQTFAGGSSSPSDQTVTGQVYGNGSDTSAKVNIQVHETATLSYKKIAVSVPRGISK